MTIGVYGHVDHGKTALIKKLTGIDTDRLKEEKARGVSIEAGFAYLETPDGKRLGVVDAPGHGRFIGNMLAAASGISLALLVVAADEGVMPQTREHLDILRLLGIRHGIIAITKTDLADGKMLAGTCGQVKNLVDNTFLQGARIIGVSVKTGRGLDALREALCKKAEEIPATPQDEAFRLPIDRVFTMRGFGTVVTGALANGALDIDSDAMLYPAGRPVRIRGIQVYSENVRSARAGGRVAVNLSVKKDLVARGDVLAAKNSLTPSMMLDVWLNVLENAAFPVKNNSRAHLYIGSKRLLAKIILLEADELSKGGCGFAQLRLAEAAAVKKGDRFVIRFYSPEMTVGGGEVLAAAPPKHRRHKHEVIERLAKLKAGLDTGDSLPPEQKEQTLNPAKKKPPRALPIREVEQVYLRFGMNPRAASVAARGMDAEDFQKALAALVRNKKLVRLDTATYIHKTCYDTAVSTYKRLAEEGPVTLGYFRDRLEISRRVAFALYGHFEASGIKTV